MQPRGQRRLLRNAAFARRTLLHLPLPLVGVPIGLQKGRQQNDGAPCGSAQAFPAESAATCRSGSGIIVFLNLNSR